VNEEANELVVCEHSPFCKRGVEMRVDDELEADLINFIHDCANFGLYMSEKETGWWCGAKLLCSDLDIERYEAPAFTAMGRVLIDSSEECDDVVLRC
jgi:hypothetical protein